jgi:CBS domain containing-hemolysin-like protein
LKYVEGNRKKKALDETNIIVGALVLSEKKAKYAMTPFCETFLVDINAKLDRHWTMWSDQ